MAMWDFGGCACGLSRYCDCEHQTQEDRDNIQKQKDSMKAVEVSELVRLKKQLTAKMEEIRAGVPQFIKEEEMSPRHPSEIEPHTYTPGPRQAKAEELNLPDKPSVKKDTNPKDAVGIRKPRFYSGMSAHVDRLVSLGLMEGAMKYGRHNYRPAAVRSSVYYDATREHLGCFWEGEDIDPDSGLPHVIKAICSLYVLADAIITGNMVDDRPPRTQNPREFANRYQGLVDRLFERYPNPVPAYTEHSVREVKPSEEK